jgi:uncharacterized protein
VRPDELEFRPENAHVVNHSGMSVLVAAKTMSLFTMDPLSEAVLRYCETKRRFTLDDVVRHLSNDFVGEDIAHVVKEFMNVDVVVGQQSSGAVALPFVDTEHFPLSSLVLNVTNKCNLHCTYCYEPDGAKYGPAPVRMEWDTARASVDFLFEKAGRNREVNIVFFGGEALLNFKLMKQVVEYAENKGVVAGKKVDFSITTNGTLLVDEIIDFLQRHLFGVTISIDGPKEIHDRRRFFLTNTGEQKGSYDQIMGRVKRLLERYTARPIVARVTVTKGAVEIVRIYEHLNSLGFFEVGFSPVTAKPGLDYGLGAADLREVLAGFKELGATYVERALRSQYTGFSNLSTMMTDLHLGTNKMFPCGAGLGLLDVDGNGDVYLCHRFPGNEEHKYGSVKEGIEYDRLTEFVNSVQVGNKPVCQTCWIRGICGGGCYHEALQEFGEAALPNLHYCVFLREWTEYGIGVFTELEQKNPGFVEKYIVRSRGDVPKELS